MQSASASATEDRLPVAAVALLWAGTAAALALMHWATLDDAYRSPDNAMRLVQVHAFIDGASWFDPHEPRLDPPLGYDTHWSRLLDAGIVGLIFLFRQFTNPDFAERLARCVWPLLLSGPAVIASYASALRIGGAGAARATLMIVLLTLLFVPGIFLPGEIDHHNAQVMLTLVMIACVLWCDDSPWLAAAGGIAGGLLLGVGLEAAAPLVAVGAALAMLFVHDARWRVPVRAFVVALGGATALAYALLTPAAFRFVPMCDELGVNTAAAVVAGSLGLALVTNVGDRWTRMQRLVATAVAGALALVVFAAIEPRCLRGPIGLVDPAITALWINNVSELQSVFSLIRNLGAEAVVHIAFPCLVIASAVFVIWRGLRTPLAWAPLAAVAVSSVITAGTIRMGMYVVMLGMPFVGAAVDALSKRTTRPLLVGVGGAALASPPISALVVIWLAAIVGEPMGKPAAAKTAPLWTVDVSRCLHPEIYRPVAAMPPGLIFGPLELGPSLLAFTPHSVVDAGYHRAYKSIIFEEEVMRGSASAARERLVERGVAYVMTCADFPNYPNPAAFYNALLTGAAPAWLERVPLPEGNVLRMWRVRGDER
ncbi:MAG: hypothetical protein JO328_12135 [Hyphomicrobiales bacterium]|nr:hypothetical protein [Hyphomicrobiales bacterium]MBV8826105.1 hypothetical protein [Hyphomicrobiales bacterium]MBV9429196.1 hypothetical protein [Bradyrhizobiaceae bacterium]